MGDNGKSEIAKPHDALVRYFLGDTKLAADFLHNYLPPALETKLEWGSLVPEPVETVAKDLNRRIGDLRYSARFKGGGAELNVCVMVEHQSKPDSLMSFRMMEYICAAYQQRVSAFRDGTRFPYPLAVVLHHGKKPWKQIPPMRDLITIPPGLDTDILNFPIHLIDLAAIPLEELRGHPAICALFCNPHQRGFCRTGANRFLPACMTSAANGTCCRGFRRCSGIIMRSAQVK